MRITVKIIIAQLAVSTFIFSNLVHAENGCNVMAGQIDANIKTADPITQPAFMGYCLYTMNMSEKGALFKSNVTCPLPLSEVLAKGVLVPKDATTRQCVDKPGDRLEGMLIRKGDDPNAFIFLDD